MNKPNQKPIIAALHRAQMIDAAHKLFLEKGFKETTIDDISKASGYSRRTIYTYYKSKEDLLYQILVQGLEALKKDIETAIAKSDDDFIHQFDAICQAMHHYHQQYPYSVMMINQTSSSKLESSNALLQPILLTGYQINERLTEWISQGQANGIVLADLPAEPTVYILWSNITSLINLAQTKESFFLTHLGITQEAFLEMGFKQLLNGIVIQKR